ncbi:MAG TPA: hypothetical protein VD710_10960 [Nitrososphaeraceae archaeon]|nr:hypothetical protein [Nitrososphaeraceae archaeon]
MTRGMTILAGTVIGTILIMMTAPIVSAATSAFTIVNFGIVDKSPSMTVEGIAGSEIPNFPDSGEWEIFAYVFYTDDGIYAVTSHPEIEDSNEVKNDSDWHAHKVQLNDENCIIDRNEKGKAVLDGNTVSVKQTKATAVTKVLTGEFAADVGKDACLEGLFDSQE